MIKSDEAQNLIDCLNTAVLIFDQDLTLCGINTSGENLLSTSFRIVRRQAVEALISGFPIGEHMREAVETGQPFTQRDLKLKFTGGKIVNVDCTVTPVSNDHTGEGILLEMSVVDRHHRIVREEKMISQQHATSALVQGIAHEIKNPLGGLRGAAQLLERELSSESHKEYTRIIIEEADRLSKLVDQMWGPTNMPHMEQINIHEVVEHVRQLVATEIPETVGIVCDYDPSLPDVFADRDHLIQAQLNIVKNAVQAVSNSGAILLRTRSERQFTIGPKRHRLVIRIDVVDDGPGIPGNIKDEVFYPMVTGRPGGTGLGLSIAQSLIHRIGGLIEFSSHPGETIFTTWLPVEDKTE